MMDAGVIKKIIAEALREEADKLIERLREDYVQCIAEFELRENRRLISAELRVAAAPISTATSCVIAKRNAH